MNKLYPELFIPSIGGHVALELAKHYPNKIKSAFISGITITPMGPKIFKVLLPIQSHFVQKGLNNIDSLLNLAKKYQLPEEKIPVFIENYRLLSQETYENIFQELYFFKMEDSYATIDIPIIFVAGEKEEKDIQYTLKEAPKVIKKAKTALIPKAEHQWPVQKPDIFNTLLRNWLETSS